MNISNHTKTVSVNQPQSAWLLLVLFFWFLVNNLFEEFDTLVVSSAASGLAYTILNLFVSPIIYATVVAGIAHVYVSKSSFDFKETGNGLNRYYFRFLLIQIVIVALYGIVQVLHSNMAPGKSYSSLSIDVFRAIIAAFKIAWLAIVVVNRGRIFQSLFRVVRLFVSYPRVAVVCLLAAGIATADNRFGEIPETILSEKVSSALIGFRALAAAMLYYGAWYYVVKMYNTLLITVFGENEEIAQKTETRATPEEPKRIKSPLWLVFLSFIPVFHIITLVSGLRTLKRNRGRSIRTLLAVTFGAFFTSAYILAVVGYLMKSGTGAEPVGYQFLEQAEPALQPAVAHLVQGEFDKAKEKLEQAPDSLKKAWPYITAKAVCLYGLNDSAGTAEEFGKALLLNPDRSEYYYHYGTVLLGYNEYSEAKKQFETCITRKPEIKDAQRYIQLVNNRYEPSRAMNIAWSIIILLILFTFHEYAHAYAACKLGDDTAAQQGRLTLNPIAHLDLVGSILLPAILMWRESDVVFGWAKPVPVNPQKFSDPIKDDMIVSFAGPWANLLMALGSVIIIMLILIGIRLDSPDAVGFQIVTSFEGFSIAGSSVSPWVLPVIAFLKQFLFTSLVLGCFNLLPIPPLDGSWIFSGILPEKARAFFEKTRKFSFVFFLLIVMTPALDYILMIPVGLVIGMAHLFFMAMGFA